MQVRDSTIDSRESLIAAIERLEAEQKEHIDAIKTDMHDAYESLKPVHVIKTLVKELFTSPEVRQDLFQSGVGLGAGFLAKKLVVGNSHNLFKRLMGHLVQVSVTNMVNSNEEVIESKGRSLIQRLIKRYRPSEETDEEKDLGNRGAGEPDPDAFGSESLRENRELGN
jgi:hypothetical protein